MTLAIYSALESDLAPALVLSAVMVLVAFTVLAVVRRLGRLHAPR
jgi:molybdate transport system permease protein